MYHSLVIRNVYARVPQIARLATDAADQLMDAVGILDDARAGIVVRGEGPLLTHRQALGEAGSHLTLARDLTALGTQDALTTAEQLIIERRRRGVSPQHPIPALSPAQEAALRAIARGEVTIDRLDNKPYIRPEGIRITISTIRSLASCGLVAREAYPLCLHDERVHLTADGCRSLATIFGRPRTTALTTARRAAPVANATAGRSR